MVMYIVCIKFILLNILSSNYSFNKLKSIDTYILFSSHEQI